MAIILPVIISQGLVQFKIHQANLSLQQEQWWTNRAITGLNLKVQVEHQVAALAECAYYNDPERFQHFEDLSGQVTALLNQFIGETKRQHTKNQLINIKNHQTKLVELTQNEIFPAIQAGNTGLTQQLLEERAEPLVNQIAEELESWVADRQNEVLEQQKIATAAGAGAAKYGVIFTLLAILMGAIISSLISRSITKPLQKVITKAQMLAQGDLTGRLEQTDRRDEIGDLMRAFDQMEQELQQLLSAIATNSINLAAHSQQLSASSEEVNSNVQMMAGVTTQLAATAQNQAANAQDAVAVSKDAETMAQDGGRLVQEVVHKMESISNSVNDSATMISKLAEQSQRIGQIIEAITSITDQTNLLALNATIEAARAGEHGRGFAVVADEVRTLAEKSSEAAKEIYSIVSVIRQDIEQAVQAMDIGAREVSEGVAVVEKAGLSLEEIVDKVINSSNFIGEISVSTGETSDATVNLAQSTDHIHSAVEQITQSAIGLTEMAEELNDLTSHFNFKREEQKDY